ncbi:MAG: hypothetical protein J1D86_00560 [Alistipes sp.]|nr:hypothetical protein [Alistipes sp.]
MKNLALLLWVAFVVCACTDGAAIRRMNLAGSLLDDSPEAALASLDSITESDLRGTASRARYALLRSRVLDKLHVDLESDSIIKPAVDYYSRFGDCRRKMLTNYCYGRIEQNCGHATSALKIFMDAETFALRSGDNFYLGLIQSNIAALYFMQNQIEKAIQHYIRAYRYYEEDGNDLYAADVLIATASAYANAHEYNDWAIFCYNIALDFGEKLTDKEIQANALRGLAMISYDNNPEQSIEYMDKLQMITEYTLSDYITKAAIYANLGRKDEAKHIIDSVKPQLLTDDSQYIRANRLLKEIYEDRGDYKQALGCNDEYQRMNDSILLWNLYNSVAEKESEIKKVRAEERHRRSVVRAWISIAAMLLIMVAMLVVFLRFRDKREKEKKLLKQAVHTKFFFRNRLAETVYTSITPAQERQNVKELIDAEFGTRLFVDMAESVNVEYDGLYERVSGAVALSEREKKMFLLLCCNFSVRSICMILGLTTDAAYKCKSRLVKKLTESTTDTTFPFRIADEKYRDSAVARHEKSRKNDPENGMSEDKIKTA